MISGVSTDVMPDVDLTDGRHLPADLVACGIGISGNHNHGPLPLFVFQRRT